MPDPSDLTPASEDLCARLGINPEDLRTLPKRGPPTPTSQPARRPLPPAMQAAVEETVSTKEAVLTVLATYLANKDEDWWELSSADRDEEICFVADALIRTYRKLEHA